MKTLEPTPKPYWWSKPPTTLLYFIREINGILLGLMALAIIVCTILSQLFSINIDTFGYITFGIFFCISVIHSVTWFFAMPKIAPVDLPPVLQKTAPFMLIIFWILLTCLLINLLYIK